MDQSCWCPARSTDCWSTSDFSSSWDGQLPGTGTDPTSRAASLSVLLQGFLLNQKGHDTSQSCPGHWRVIPSGGHFIYWRVGSQEKSVSVSCSSEGLVMKILERSFRGSQWDGIPAAYISIHIRLDQCWDFLLSCLILPLPHSCLLRSPPSKLPAPTDSSQALLLENQTKMKGANAGGFIFKSYKIAQLLPPTHFQGSFHLHLVLLSRQKIWQ